jgi:cyclic pyranopterin phosphate synthase
MAGLQDQYGRTFKTLRVSLINTCNLGCVYCTMADTDIKASNHLNKGNISVEQFLAIIDSLHQELNLETVRLTGGEPLLYPDLVQVVAGIMALGLKDIKLTTNGFLLERMAPDLQKAGMTSINVSLDAIDEAVFFKMSKRNDVERILKGIKASINCGLDVKINAVIMKGMNEDQIFPLLDFTFKHNIQIRFLEVMAMGHLYKHSEKYLFTQDDILSKIALRYSFERMERKASATSNYWKTKEGGIFGIIANESEPFCGDCNRLRLDSRGNIFGCLSDNHPISIKEINNKLELQQKLKIALAQKQTVRFVGSELSMLEIGG